MPELGWESTQSASSCLPHTNMIQNCGDIIVAVMTFFEFDVPLPLNRQI
jgi:hypothetical protein